MTICNQCGARNQVDAHFCAQCGTALTAEAGGAPTSARRRNLGASVSYLLLGSLCLLYLFNPTLGVFELLPDNLPGVGNLDEAAATAGLLWAMNQLGLRWPRA